MQEPQGTRPDPGRPCAPRRGSQWRAAQARSATSRTTGPTRSEPRSHAPTARSSRSSPALLASIWTCDLRCVGRPSFGPNPQRRDLRDRVNTTSTALQAKITVDGIAWSLVVVVGGGQVIGCGRHGLCGQLRPPGRPRLHHPARRLVAHPSESFAFARELGRRVRGERPRAKPAGSFGRWTVRRSALAVVTAGRTSGDGQTPAASRRRGG